MNQLILGDCLEVLKKIESNSIDLIYLDPPFFSNRNYEVIWGDKGEIRSFQDRWSGGIDHYIAWLKERVIEMHRVLKPTGSIFLHCDWHANAYIRVLILDKVFGEGNFINEFIWKRSSNRSSIARSARRNYDTIFFYSKTSNYVFNQLFTKLSKTSEKLYSNEDEKGFYQKVPLLVSGKRNGETGKIWRGIDPNKLGQAGMHWLTTLDKLEEYDKNGLVYWSKNGTPRLKYYIEQSPGVPISEVWEDVNLVSGNESIGYPTQKPEALLERIIQCASNEGDLILDPFLGGGTTVAVADRLKRQWIGIDSSVAAIKVSELRLNKQRDLFSIPFTIQLHKYDYHTLRNNNAFEFETWIIQQYGGEANIKQRGDLGIDGRDKTGTPIQVKRSDNIGRNIIDNFKAACERYDKNLSDKNKQAAQPIGTIIAFSFGKGAIQEVARLKNEENIIIKLVTVEDIVPIAKKPEITLSYLDLGIDKKQLHEIEFTAHAITTVNIEFYAWDWNYNVQEGFKPAIVRDTVGKQIQKFKSGVHCIAVMVIDNDGLENIAVLNFKINGLITT